VNDLFKFLIIHSNLIVSTCALIVAFLVFLATAWQGYLARKHNRLSVKPILEVESHMASNVNFMGLKIENCGVGPAIIKKIEIFYRNDSLGVVSDGDWIHRIGEHGVPVGTTYATLQTSDSLIKSGGYLWLLKNDDVEKGENCRRFKSLLDEVTISIKYESIYGEKFKL